MGLIRPNPLLSLVFQSVLISIATATYSDEADFIIVGGGTAGCVLASRLCTALPHAKIFLLERGKPLNETETLLSLAPRYTFDAWGTPSLTEIGIGEPDAGINGQSAEILTGATLGGTSAINGGHFTYPQEGTFPSYNISGLGDRSAKKMFQKVRKTVGFSAASGDALQDYATLWIDAAVRSGIPRGPPFALPLHDKSHLPYVAIDEKGRRVSSYRAYLTADVLSKCKNNLRIIQGALVKKILFSRNCRPSYRRGKSTGRFSGSYRTGKHSFASRKCAIGVRVVRNGRMSNIYAREEVISSAGPYGSPKLLMLSGIGRKSVLQEQGVKVVQNLPVGRFAQARPLTSLAYIYTKVPLARENNQTNLRSPEAIAQFVAGNGGPLSTALSGGTAQLRDVAYIESSTALPPIPEVLNQPVLICACLVNPSKKSYATLELRDKRLLTPLKVETNFLSQPEDIDRMITCLNRVRDLEVELNKTMGLIPLQTTAEGTIPDRSDSREVREAFIRNTSASAYHFVGGCAVGKVVDRDMYVKGFANLRVIDASAIPTMPVSSGPMSSVYIIAEHMAKKLIKKYRRFATN